jgi:hypothetical protein
VAQVGGVAAAPGKVVSMADGSVHRTVTVECTGPGVFTVTNTRGGQIRFGTGSGDRVHPH